MKSKINKFIKILDDHNVDALLIHSKVNKKYIGALTGSGVKVLITKNHFYQLMDGRYINEANLNTNDFENIVFNQGENYLELVKKICGNSKIAIETNQIFIKEYLEMQKLGLNIYFLDDQLSRIRMCKDEHELFLIQKACDITDRVYAQLLEKIHVGMTEKEVAAWINFLSLKEGANSMSFETIVVSGIRGCLPHGRPSDKVLNKGELVTVDFGVVYNGYQSDMTRTFAIGKVSDELIKIYDTVYLAQTKGVEFIRANVTGSQVDKYVRDIIQQKGYGQYFTHGLGHGIGMGENELPLLNKNSEMILLDGMVMSCEPGIYIENLGGVRIEDDVAIINGKGMALNKSPKELIVSEG